ncbi:MAG: hypothetical protein AAF125_08495 [Chloroflexota bacterium]
MVGHFRLLTPYLDHEARRVRLAACRALVSVASSRHWWRWMVSVPERVWNVLYALLATADTPDAPPLEKPDSWVYPTTHADVFATMVGYAKMRGEDALIGLLNDPVLPDDMVHETVGVLVDVLFDRVNSDRSDERRSYLVKSPASGFDSDVYQYGLRKRQVRKIPLMRGARERKVLQAIVDCDRFWTQETNLLSFFYGLPDDRKGLQQFARAENPQESRLERLKLLFGEVGGAW